MCVIFLISYHISHLLVSEFVLLSEGYIAIVHDAISSYTDTIPWLVEEKNTLNCKQRILRYIFAHHFFHLTHVPFIHFAKGFVCFGIAMASILAAARQTRARRTSAKQLRRTMGGKQFVALVI